MKPVFFTLPLLTLALATASAQSPSDRAISSVQSASVRAKASTMLKRSLNETAAPEIFPGELDDVGPQFLLVPSQPSSSPADTPEKRPLLEAFLDTQLYYTSNALLTEKGNSDTALMVTTLQAAFNLPAFELAGGRVDTKAGYRHQWWMYSLNDSGSGLNDFDFAVSTFFIQGRHTFSDQWASGFGLDYNRLLSHENDWTEFYTELVPSWYLERTIALGEKATLTTGLYGAYHWTHTDDIVAHINDRLDTSLGVSLSYEVVPGVIAQPYYRLQWSHYTSNSDRNDFYHSIGFGVSHAFNEWSSVRAFVSYENRDSTDDLVADYGKWDSGLGLTLSMKF